MKWDKKRHATPLDVATVLATHAPQKIASILEPAVGSGVLLRPLIDRLRKNARKIVCVDSNPGAISHMKMEFGGILGKPLQLVNEDFLNWAQRYFEKSGKLFDCVLMNPPFSGRKASMVKLVLNETRRTDTNIVKYVPVEVAFVVLGAKLLKMGGKLLGIVPASLVSASSTCWVRNYLLSIGCVKLVHELPRFTFRDVEAKVYLLIFERGKVQRSLTLCNHDLFNPEKLRVTKSSLSSEVRFDYSFNEARLWLDGVRNRFPSLEWEKLRNIACVLRGSEKSPDGPSNSIHTCDYQNNGFWDSGKRRTNLTKGEGIRVIKKGDLLIRRVGRGCSKSIGPIIGHDDHTCSDCILLVRAKNFLSSLRLLFVLRVIVVCGHGSLLVERGTGASYITESALLELPIPMGLPLIFACEFESYEKAFKKKDAKSMRSIESKVYCLLKSKSENEVLALRQSRKVKLAPKILASGPIKNFHLPY